MEVMTMDWLYELLDPEERDPEPTDPRTWAEHIADEMWEERKETEKSDAPGGH